MSGRNIFYTLLLIFFTVCSVLTMLYFDILIDSVGFNYNYSYYTVDDKYTGYIFDDYNIPVNLEYRETADDSKDAESVNTINTISQHPEDPDNLNDVKFVRSEKIIEDISQMEEKLSYGLPEYIEDEDMTAFPEDNNSISTNEISE